MESDERVSTNKILAELLKRKDGSKKPPDLNSEAAMLALMLANRAMTLLQPLEGGNVDFSAAIPVRPPVA